MAMTNEDKQWIEGQFDRLLERLDLLETRVATEFRKLSFTPAPAAMMMPGHVETTQAVDELTAPYRYCQHCGGSQKEHRPGGYCRSRSDADPLQQSTRWTPWTREEWLAAVAKGKQAAQTDDDIGPCVKCGTMCVPGGDLSVLCPNPDCIQNQEVV